MCAREKDSEKSGERGVIYGDENCKRRELTSVLTGDEIDVITQFDFKVAMAHEILESNLGDYTRAKTPRSHNRINPRFRHWTAERFLLETNKTMRVFYLTKMKEGSRRQRSGGDTGGFGPVSLSPRKRTEYAAVTLRSEDNKWREYGFDQMC